MEAAYPYNDGRRLDCLPSWHDLVARWQVNRRFIYSGCPTVAGNVTCSPESMRANAEMKLRQLGVWPWPFPLSLEMYTLARYMGSEIGSVGTPEEKVAVGQAAVNRARREHITINDLLLYRSGNQHYGPIHDATMGAPFRRWASTARDPAVDDLIVAMLIMSGRAGNFAQGADDQDGPEVEGDANHPVGWAYNYLAYNANKNDYWVGPLANVDHWKTFLYQHRPDVPPTSELGRAFVTAAQQALSQRPTPWRDGYYTRTDWSSLRGTSCPPEGALGTGAKIAVAAGGLALAGGLFLFLTREPRHHAYGVRRL
jgi:hypothetical protein